MTEERRHCLCEEKWRDYLYEEIEAFKKANEEEYLGNQAMYQIGFLNGYINSLLHAGVIERTEWRALDKQINRLIFDAEHEK